MEGKKNIVFGFLYFVVTAITGLIMTTGGMLGEVGQAKNTAAEKVTALEKRLETGGPNLAAAAGEAVSAVEDWLQAQDKVGEMAGAPHTHGNLEALANIVVGLFLGLLAVPSALKQLISWLFIAAAVLHSGMLYLGVVFGLSWPWAIVNLSLGPIALLAGLLLAGLAAIMGYRPAGSST
jgi:hypothetical protein